MKTEAVLNTSRRIVFSVLLVTAMLTAGAPSFADERNTIFKTGELIIKFKGDISKQHRLDIFADYGLRHLRSGSKNRFHVVKVGKDRLELMMELLSGLPGIKYVEPNYQRFASFVPDDDSYDEQWNFDMIHMEDAWDICTGEGVTVAVVDTGVNPHGNDGFGNRLMNGYNAITGSASGWYDDNGHGTHVSGTISQATNNSTGVAGIAFDATIMPVKVLDADGIGTAADVVEGIYWAVDNGADIINLSLGSYYSSYTEEAAINYAYSNGVTVIASAGNDGRAIKNYPAAYDTVIAVGSIGPRKKRSYFSNFGRWVDFTAPGEGVLQETFYYDDWDYQSWSGTSMAAPHVAGVAALIKSRRPSWGPAQIKQALIMSAEDLGLPGKDFRFGYGLVDACEAVCDLEGPDPGAPEKEQPGSEQPGPGDSCSSGMIYDCSMTCVSASTVRSWIGDGYCDIGEYGVDLRCSAFDNDGGDCM